MEGLTTSGRMTLRVLEVSQAGGTSSVSTSFKQVEIVDDGRKLVAECLGFLILDAQTHQKGDMLDHIWRRW